MMKMEQRLLATKTPKAFDALMDQMPRAEVLEFFRVRLHQLTELTDEAVKPQDSLYTLRYLQVAMLAFQQACRGNSGFIARKRKRGR